VQNYLVSLAINKEDSQYSYSAAVNIELLDYRALAVKE